MILSAVNMILCQNECFLPTMLEIRSSSHVGANAFVKIECAWNLLDKDVLIAIISYSETVQNLWADPGCIGVMWFDYSTTPFLACSDPFTHMYTKK